MQKGHVGLPLPRSIKGGYRPGLLKWLSKTRIHGCEKKWWLVGHGQWAMGHFGVDESHGGKKNRSGTKIITVAR